REKRQEIKLDRGVECTVEILMINSQKIKVILDKQDMEKMNITVESLDYLTAQARKTILRILADAKQKTGFEPIGTKLYIETFPEETGGCILLLSSRPEEKKLPEATKMSPAGPVLFGFEDLEILITASCKLFRRYCHRVYKSSLYRLENIYVLMVYPLDKVDRLTVSFLCEFGEKLGEGVVAAAVVEEHGTAILKENAIDTISEYLDRDDELSDADLRDISGGSIFE
ncbi:MAG: adaptor protein MecA, partial [Oscillospiraceae bacterium]